MLFRSLHDAVSGLLAKQLVATSPLREHVAAVSVGMHGGTPLLDLDYLEDSSCDTDMNVVMTGSGGLIEIQGTAEGVPFSRKEMDAMVELAQQGIRALIGKQRAALGLD